MNPIFSRWNLPSYAACMVLGFVTAFLLARWRGRREGIASRHFENLILLTALAGSAGAILFGRIFYQHESFTQALRFWEGGPRVYYGGFIAALAALVIYCKVASLPLLQVMDVSAPAVAIPLAIGRVGCFLAGCCWGDVCVDQARLANTPLRERAAVYTVPSLSRAGFPLAVTFPRGSHPHDQHVQLGLVDAAAERSAPVHPVQLYEAVAALALGCWLHWRFNQRRFHGELAVKLLIGYALIRFTVEFFRAGNPPDYFGLTISQLIALTLAIGTVGWLAFRRQHAPAIVPR